jgi:glycerophosphoryl diester phosphodiesterase
MAVSSSIRPGKRPTRQRRWILGTLLLVGLLPLVVGRWSTEGAATPPRRTSSQVAACIRDPACHDVLVAAHRAEGFGGAQNSLAAVRLALEAAVPVIEIDLRGSSDGQLFVMHDGRLEHATTLHGRVEERSADEIGRARLKNGEPVPRFEDVYALTRGRAVLSVDFKVPEQAMAQVADWIAARGSFDDLIFFANTGEEIAVAARAKARYPQMIVMVRLLDTRVTVESTRGVFGGRLPDIFHTDRVGAEQVRALHALGVKVYMNALPLDRYIEPFRYFAVRSLLATGVDLVLTGDPRTMMRKAAALPAR